MNKSFSGTHKNTDNKNICIEMIGNGKLIFTFVTVLKKIVQARLSFSPYFITPFIILLIVNPYKNTTI